MSVIPEYSGDFMKFDCPNCYRQTRVVIKNEELNNYFCAYCGLSIAIHRI